jgi:hypothetical protein
MLANPSRRVSNCRTLMHRLGSSDLATIAESRANIARSLAILATVKTEPPLGAVPAEAPSASTEPLSCQEL